MSEAARQAPVVSGAQVIAAGFAAATAAFVTSRFGVAGTLLGASVTAMIITGGSAILRSYLEGVTGNVRKMPRKYQARRERRKAQRYGEPEMLSERPDLRDNFAGRLRAALGWFSNLPPLSRRSILVKGLIAAAVAFVIGMGAVWGVERVINNSLSCGFWANCPEGATPGIHLNDEGQGANSTISLGRARTKEGVSEGVSGGVSRSGALGPAYRQNGGAQQDGGVQQNRSYEQGTPDFGQQPAAPRGGGSSDQQGGGLFQPDRPVKEPAAAPVQPETPNSASPAPEESPPPEESAPPGGAKEPGIAPQDASPAPAQ
ncbi:MAG: hypothetical protein ACJ73Z_00890 [Rubrobacteraceae bacterium]